MLTSVPIKLRLYSVNLIRVYNTLIVFTCTMENMSVASGQIPLTKAQQINNYSAIPPTEAFYADVCCRVISWFFTRQPMAGQYIDPTAILAGLQVSLNWSALCAAQFSEYLAVYCTISYLHAGDSNATLMFTTIVGLDQFRGVFVIGTDMHLTLMCTLCSRYFHIPKFEGL